MRKTAPERYKTTTFGCLFGRANVLPMSCQCLAPHIPLTAVSLRFILLQYNVPMRIPSDCRFCSGLSAGGREWKEQPVMRHDSSGRAAPPRVPSFCLAESPGGCVWPHIASAKRYHTIMKLLLVLRFAERSEIPKIPKPPRPKRSSSSGGAVKSLDFYDLKNSPRFVPPASSSTLYSLAESHPLQHRLFAGTATQIRPRMRSSTATVTALLSRE